LGLEVLSTDAVKAKVVCWAEADQDILIDAALRAILRPSLTTSS